MIDRLADALALHSPRFCPPHTPLRSALIHGTVGLAWLVLFASAFVVGGVWAWSTGVAYIAYDTALLAFVGWKTLALLRRRATAAPTSSAPRERLAVVIAAHDEATVLPATVAALLAQDDPPDAIVIADDGSTDDTHAVLTTRYGFALPAAGGIATSTIEPTLHWLRLEHGGKARALNAALAAPAVDASIVVTVDADTHLAPGAVRAMRSAFSAEPALVAATGVLTPICSRTPLGRVFQWFQTYEYIRNFLSRYAWMRIDSLLLISGAFAGFRRDAVIAVGGFDPRCLVEDYELIHRLARHSSLHRLGWTSRVLGNARATTDAPATVSAFLRQRRRWFGGFLQTQYWYRAMVGDGRFGNVGRFMLPVKALDTMQPVFGLTALVVLVAALAQGRTDVLVPVSAWIGAKIVLDLGFHLWSIHLYRRWVGGKADADFGLALLAALAEPFSFQILRHLGATLGWVTFLTRRRRW